MGRTNPTYRDQLRGLEDRWHAYRRGLRLEDQAHFDRLFEQARAYADAAGYQNATDPMTPFLVSILLAQQKQVATLEARLDRLEGRIRDDADEG